MKHLATLAIVLSFTACKKEKKVSGDPSAKPTDKAPDKGSGPFAAWDMAGRKAAMQGAHVTPGDALGLWEAWNVEGDKVTIWDGTTEKVLEISVISPCEVKTTESSAGGSMSTTSHYTLLDGKLVKGHGDAGSRKGPEAIACISNTVFSVDAKGTCTEWSASMFGDGKYEQKPGTCGFKKEGDKEVFAATVNGHETTLDVHGDALLSEQLFRDHSEKVADYAAAKAARDAKK
jgi:hypothetical protein